MAYVPQIGEFENDYLGKKETYFINGKEVSYNEYTNTLKTLIDRDPIIKNLRAKLKKRNISRREKADIHRRIIHRYDIIAIKYHIEKR